MAPAQTRQQGAAEAVKPEERRERSEDVPVLEERPLEKGLTRGGALAGQY